MLYQGGCHCGAVTFEVQAEDEVEVEDCNCSICRMTGYLHMIVPQRHFRLLSGAEYLSAYKFNSGIAEHKFCRICGIKSFYVPRSNPDGIDINLRCLKNKPRRVRIVSFDGINWESHAHRLAHKSE